MLYTCVLLYVTLIYVRPAEIYPEWATVPLVDILTVVAAIIMHFLGGGETAIVCQPPS